MVRHSEDLTTLLLMLVCKFSQPHTTILLRSMNVPNMGPIMEEQTFCRHVLAKNTFLVLPFFLQIAKAERIQEFYFFNDGTRHLSTLQSIRLKACAALCQQSRCCIKCKVVFQMTVFYENLYKHSMKYTTNPTRIPTLYCLEVGLNNISMVFLQVLYIIIIFNFTQDHNQLNIQNCQWLVSFKTALLFISCCTL